IKVLSLRRLLSLRITLISDWYEVAWVAPKPELTCPTMVIKSTISGFASRNFSAFWVRILVCSMAASLGSSICTKNSPLSIAGKNSPPTNPAPTKVMDPKNIKTAIPNVVSLVFQLFRLHFNRLDIQWVNSERAASNFKITFPKKVLLDTCSNFPNLEESQGTIVKEARKENPVAIITVTQSCFIIFDTTSLPKEIGRNTTMITKVIATTVNPIS